MSSRSKGRAFERLVGAWLRREGWTVDDESRGKLLPIGPGRFINKAVDLFGCIDIIAMQRQRGLWFIQATSGGDVAAKRQEVAALPWPRTQPIGLGDDLAAGLIPGLRVSVFEAATRRNVLNPRKLDRLARVHDLTRDGWEMSVLDLTPAASPPATRRRTT